MKVKARLKASVIHMLISAMVLLVFFSVVYFIWYPNPLHQLHSTLNVTQIVVAVDLVLGPLLTLVIFNIKKPRAELVRDVSLIVLVQIIALGWGMHITHKVRPAFVVFHLDAMYSVTRDDIQRSTSADESLLPYFWQKPEYVYIPPLQGEEVVQHVVNVIKKGESDIMYHTDRYLPFMENIDEMLARSLDISAYVENKPGTKKYLDKFLQDNQGVLEDYVFFPLEYGQFKAIMAFDKKDMTVVGLVGPVYSAL